MPNNESSSLVRFPIAGLLSWILPGLGHLFLGDKARGITCLITVTATFWTGVAIGGVRSTVDPQERKLWFVAQLGTGGNTLAAYAIHRGLRAKDTPDTPKFFGHWASIDVGVHYTGVAGLLNLLVMFDAIARADPSHVRRSRREDSEQPG